MCIIRKTIEERKESMAKGKALDGKPYAGNPHVRFDEGEVAPAATPRRGSLLYKTYKIATIAGDGIGPEVVADAPAAELVTTPTCPVTDCPLSKSRTSVYTFSSFADVVGGN